MTEPRLLSRDAAAEYCGLSPNAFEQEVAAGTFPEPFKLAKVRRQLWDMRALDAAIDKKMTVEIHVNDWNARKQGWRVRNQNRAQGAR
jgi:predicted DNA-binding transcriptional regulator AlpA